jgi:hypothetical protein
MVAILAPSRAAIGVTQARTGSPLTWTVQAPHWAKPQPNFVPVSPSSSRSTHSRGVSGAAFTTTVLPLMSKVDVMAFASQAKSRARRPSLRESNTAKTQTRQ